LGRAGYDREGERERENTINEERGKRVLRIFCGIVA
jgi:hypothetical protein